MVEEVEIQEPLQQEPDPPKKKLWKSLYDKHLYTKSFEDFGKQFSTPESIDRLHKVLTEKELYTKNTDDFKNQFFSDTQSVKKKVGRVDLAGSSLDAGNSLSSSNGVGSEEIPTIEMYTTPSGEMVEADPISLSKKYNELKNKTTIHRTGGEGTASQFVPDEESKKSAQKLQEDFKDIDLGGIYEETKDLSDDIIANHGKRLMQERIDNPQLYQRDKANLQWRSGLEHTILESVDKGNITPDEYNQIKHDIDMLPVNAGQGEYSNQRLAVKTLANDIRLYGGDKKDDLLKNLAIETSKVYGNAYNNKLENAIKDSPESKYMNEDAQLGYHYLQDLSPEKAKQYERLLIDPKTLKDKSDEQKGYNHSMQILEETGIGLQQNSVTEELNSLKKQAEQNGGLSPEQITKAEQLETKQKELDQKRIELDKKYPDRMVSKVDDAMQELFGQKLNFGEYAIGKTLEAGKNTVEGIWQVVSTPFISKESTNMRELAIMGDQLGAEKLFHKTDKNKNLLTDELIIKPDLQAQIDAIQSDKNLSDTQKKSIIRGYLENNPDKFGRVPIQNGKFNINPSSILYGVTDLATSLLPFVAIETATGGIGGAGQAAKFIRTATAAFATTFHDEYANALMEGKTQSEAYKSAMGSTAINSMAMAGAGTPTAIKEMAAGMKTSASKIIAQMSEAEIEKVLAKGTPKGLKAFGQSLKDRIKSTPAMVGEGLKTGAKFEAYMAGANELNGREQNWKQSVLGIANFGIMAPGLGHIGYKSPTELQKSGLVKMGEKPDEFHAIALEMKKDGQLNDAEYNHRKDLIDRASEAYKVLPKALDNGKPIPESQKAEYLYNTVIKNEGKKAATNLPPRQAEKAEHTALVADFKNGLILEEPTDKQLESRKSSLEKQLEKKDEEGKLELADKDRKLAQAELDAINEHIELNPEVTKPTDVQKGVVTVSVKLDGKNIDAKYLDEYKGHKIVEIDGDVYTYDPKKEVLFKVALDDSKSTGSKKVNPEANNVETAKQYIDWKEGANKENKFVKPIDVTTTDVVGSEKITGRKPTAEDGEFTIEGDNSGTYRINPVSGKIEMKDINDGGWIKNVSFAEGTIRAAEKNGFTTQAKQSSYDVKKTPKWSDFKKEENKKGEVWNNRGTSFKTSENGENTFVGKDEKTYSIGSTKNADGEILVEVKDSNGNVMSSAEFDSNGDGSYSIKMGGNVKSETKGIGLAKAIYDYVDSNIGKIKKTSTTTYDGSNLWKNNSKSENKPSLNKGDVVGSEVKKEQVEEPPKGEANYGNVFHPAKSSTKTLNEKQQDLVNELPKKNVNYSELKGIGDLSIYLNNPEALNAPHLKSAKAIYEDIKNGKPIKNTPSVNEKMEVMDGQNRIAAQLAAGIENIDVAVIDKSFYDKQNAKSENKPVNEEPKANEIPNPETKAGITNEPPPENIGTAETGEERVTGVKRAITDPTRAENNMPKVDFPKMTSDFDALNEAKQRVDNGEVNPQEMVDRILKEKGNYKNEGEVMDMQYYAHQLSKKNEELTTKLAEAKTPEEEADIRSQKLQLSDLMDAQTEAAQTAGNQWGKTGNRMQPVINDAGQIFRQNKSDIKNAYAGEVPKDVQERIDAITKERDEAIAAKAKVEEELKQKMAAKGFEEIKKRAAKSAKQKETADQLKKEEQELKQQLKDLGKPDPTAPKRSGVGLTDKHVVIIGKLALNYFKQGINGLDAIIDKIHDAVRDEISGITRKDIRDLLANYDPLTMEREIERLNKKADIIEGKLIPPSVDSKGKPTEKPDLAKPSKVERTFRNNTEWVKANQRVANAEFKMKIEKRKAFESKKNYFQKGLMWLGRITRLSVLSGTTVLQKLAAAATIGSAIKRIPEQVIGAVYSQVFKGIAQKAPIEGFLNAKSEAKFYKEFFNPVKFGKNAWEILKTGSSPLSRRLGSAEYEHVPVLYLPTDTHQIIKDPPKRATFEASFRNGLIWAEKNGLDINDPLVINSLENAAYKRAQYEIFQEQNWLSKKFISYKSALEKKGNTGAVGKLLVDFMIPVSTVPTNIVRRVATTSPVGLIRGGKEVIDAYRKGIEKLTPDEADHVMQQLKQGSLGTALWLIGWYGVSSFGGLYSHFNPNSKRDEEDKVSDVMEVNGVKINKPTQHALPLEIIQTAATARRVYDVYREEKNASTPEALLKAGLASIGALVEQIPTIETPVHLALATQDPAEAEKLKEDIDRRIVPQIVREQMDKTKGSEDLKYLQDKGLKIVDLHKESLQPVDKNGKRIFVTDKMFSKLKDVREEKIKSAISEARKNGYIIWETGETIPPDKITPKQLKSWLMSTSTKAKNEAIDEVFGKQPENEGNPKVETYQ